MFSASKRGAVRHSIGLPPSHDLTFKHLRIRAVGFSFILISLSLQRMPDSFLMFVFVTCICFALVAWSGLFINRNVAPARVAIAVIPVLIMLNLEPPGGFGSYRLYIDLLYI